MRSLRMNGATPFLTLCSLMVWAGLLHLFALFYLSDFGVEKKNVAENSSGEPLTFLFLLSNSGVLPPN